MTGGATAAGAEKACFTVYPHAALVLVLIKQSYGNDT